MHCFCLHQIFLPLLFRIAVKRNPYETLCKPISGLDIASRFWRRPRADGKFNLYCCAECLWSCGAVQYGFEWGNCGREHEVEWASSGQKCKILPMSPRLTHIALVRLIGKGDESTAHLLDIDESLVRLIGKEE